MFNFLRSVEIILLEEVSFKELEHIGMVLWVLRQTHQKCMHTEKNVCLKVGFFYHLLLVSKLPIFFLCYLIENKKTLKKSNCSITCVEGIKIDGLK